MSVYKKSAALEVVHVLLIGLIMKCLALYALKVSSDLCGHCGQVSGQYGGRYGLCTCCELELVPENHNGLETHMEAGKHVAQVPSADSAFSTYSLFMNRYDRSRR